ncbi:GLPGLI family protein [Cellulophaga baltica]|uniref:GLPGLI family protein n=1 Tax=Cellulophaga TaxID=104264 RepID=UPI001C075562|nr:MULTISPECIES: GLPGLI family protein [Cellulophaga]MBU2997810.1 GLPGLI family protein [Cellulophaga baltica]MDO6769206.1 GLPGLI family protein [Cellulophaga sp. 1_MG-2023]
MKFIISLFLVYSSTLSSQSINAIYEYENLSKEEVFQINLTINNNEALSIFKPIKVLNDSVFVGECDDINFNLEGSDSIGRQYYQNLNKKIIIFRDFIYENSEFKPVIVNESYPDFEWKFRSEQKIIGDFNCNLVNLNFRGRDYSVWYTEDIPTPFGPWKFNGLPGLIVKITSLDKQINFQLIEINTNYIKDIIVPENGDKISFKEYVDYKNKTVDEFIEKLKAKLPRGAIVSVKVGDDKNIEKSFD